MAPRKRKAPDAPVTPWQHSVGIMPHRVTAYERVEKGWTLYLKWRANGNWQKESLGQKLRDERGAVIPGIEQTAVTRATERYNALVAGLPRHARPAAVVRVLTVGDTETVVTDRDTGLYPEDRPYRREVLREIRRAVAAWGADTPWTAIDVDSYTALGRKRLRALKAQGHVGLRGAEVTVTRIDTVAAWLRDTKRIPATAGVISRRWKNDIRRTWSDLHGGGDAPVSRPRHTLEETRAILQAAMLDPDPRFALLYVLGAELRLGQVKRCRRSHLDLDAGMLTVPGSGHKKGVTIELTAGQAWMARQSLALYLSDREAEWQARQTDYLLVPGGKIVGLLARKRGETDTPLTVKDSPAARKPVSRHWTADHFRAAETAAKVPHVPGRGPYGARRQAVDTANDLKVSALGLQSLGGWTDPTTPQRIYANQANLAGRTEAREAREQIRGEKSPETAPKDAPRRTPDVPHNDDAREPEGTRAAGNEG